MNYTKGEWKQGKTHTDVVYAEDEIAKIAQCYGNAGATAEANAHLISLAPRMYKALKELVERIDKGLALGEKLDVSPAREVLAQAESKD